MWVRDPKAVATIRSSPPLSRIFFFSLVSVGGRSPSPSRPSRLGSFFLRSVGGEEPRASPGISANTGLWRSRAETPSARRGSDALNAYSSLGSETDPPMNDLDSPRMKIYATMSFALWFAAKSFVLTIFGQHETNKPTTVTGCVDFLFSLLPGNVHSPQRFSFII